MQAYVSKHYIKISWSIMLKAAEHTSKISADNSPAHEFNKMSSSSLSSSARRWPSWLESVKWISICQVIINLGQYLLFQALFIPPHTTVNSYSNGILLFSTLSQQIKDWKNKVKSIFPYFESIHNIMMWGWVLSQWNRY